MPLVQDRSRSQLAFQVAGGDVDRFQVIRYRGSEGLCQLYRFEIELVSDDMAVNFDEIVGKPAVLSINTVTEERWFHGIISRFELTNQTVGQAYYRAELVPALWLLTHRYNSRIFQNKNTKDIVTEVLTRAGFSSDRFRFALQGSYTPREYCVQYRETDYNFICRLMEEEGIWWYFEQTKDAHVLVMADGPGAYKPIDGEAELPFVPPSGMSHETEHVFRFRLGRAVRPGAVALNDFNFKESEAQAGRPGRCRAGQEPGILRFSRRVQRAIHRQYAGPHAHGGVRGQPHGRRRAEQLLSVGDRADVQADWPSGGHAERYVSGNGPSPSG